MNLDWRRLRAVVLESDDWGLCAWSPDAEAHRALGDTPVFRSPAGRRYGGSTLESAADVHALAGTLAEFRGGDGFTPVWQANTIVAAPDYARMVPPAFPDEPLPILPLPRLPSRWQRPGLEAAVDAAIEGGSWWPELHGLHHLPERAWLTALRRGADDARRAFEQQSPVCEAVQASGEYDPDEPSALRERNFTLAFEGFRALFDRAPGSLCPPDYRWDEFLEAQSEALGIMVLQGKGEQVGVLARRVKRLWHRHRWPRFRNRQLYMPSRIAFEPRAGDPRTGVDAALRACRAAWGRAQPAVVSTHRVNYAHLDADASRAGRAALRDLLARLAADRARFMTDGEVAQLVARGWSVRPAGKRAARLRVHGRSGEPLRLTAPAGVQGARIAAGSGAGGSMTCSNGEIEARLEPGEYEIEWSPA